MLPFATRTDMFQALKKAYAEASDVDAFLATLLAKHDAAGARAQLKTLWIGHVCALFQEDEEAPEQSRAGWVGEGGPGMCVPGPIPRHIARGGLTLGMQPGTSHAHVVGCREHWVPSIFTY